MYEAVAFFLHHNRDAATLKHFDLLTKHNSFPIVPAHCNDGGVVNPLPNSVQIAKPFRRGRNWHNGDWVMQQWFYSDARIEAERYIYLEWDCFVDIPLKSWYAETWNSDAVGSTIERLPSNWYWFDSQYDYLPEEWKKFATAIVPLNGTLLSRQAMLAFSEIALPEAVFSEFRIGSALAALGFRVDSMPVSKAIQNVYLSDGKSLIPQSGSFYHPVKFVQDF